MSHCDYDTVFYRVFCAVLLIIAFTFTVILTNVFIDIDGLLSANDVNTKNKPDFDRHKEEDIKMKNEEQYDDRSDFTGPFRGKRSIEPNKFLFEVKNPKIKKILTNKLATLLEELDEEESTKRNVDDGRRHTNTDIIDIKEEKDIVTDNDNMLHLAMHNILLQGIIGHMDLNNVYKKVHMLIKNFYEHDQSVKLQKVTTSNEIMKDNTNNNEEQKFLEELLKCKKLRDEIGDAQNNTQFNKHKEPKISIKTIIEINEKGKLQNDNNTTTNDVVGLIKLIYNGKSIKFENLDDTENKESVGKSTFSTVTPRKSNQDNPNLNQIQTPQDKQTFKTDWNKVIENYLKQYPIGKNENYLEDKSSKMNRQKRQIKIHYVDGKHVTDKPKNPHNIKKDDEQLYIEIETHYNGKGVKGEKKKKLVQNLIDKIQRAIHGDNEAETHKKGMINHIKVKKRTQDPLKENNDFFLNKIVPVIRNIEHRQLNPISKLSIESILNDYDKIIWNENSPPLLSGIPNSTEMGSLINYANMNNIPKREQEPINIEIDELGNHVEDLKNATYYLKDIGGSGFSIGFNQYVDEPPDKNSLKLFNGVENLIKEYHKTYDEFNKNDNIDSEQKIYPKRGQESITNTHDISRRSINNYNSDSYRILLKNLIKPLNSYKKWISDDKNKYRYNSNNYVSSPNILNIISKPIKINNLSIAFINNDFIEKPGRYKNNYLDNLLIRRKRSHKVKKNLNLNSKIKLNRFINTNAKINTKVFRTKKRNKRQVNKIRIIARERAQKHSNEDNVILVAPNNLYSNNAAKEIRTDADVSDMQNTDIIPFSEFLNFNYADQPMTNEYRNDAQTLSLPKYPHVFFEEDRSREKSREDLLLKTYRIQAKRNKESPTDITERPATASSNVKLPSVEDILNAILPPKSKYKVTLKILPKNTSDVHSGFKEVHTSVNKSFDRNGFRYFSLLNVSQFSKVENVNESKETQIRRNLSPPPFINEFKEKERQIETLFQFHKKRIDSQLDNLKKERLFIENVLDKNVNKYNDNLLNFVREISTKSPMILKNLTERSKTTINIQNDEAKKIQDKREIDNSKSRRTDESKTNIFMDFKKNNEQSTKEILRRIDMNTDLLRQFLHRLSDLQIKAPSTEHVTRRAIDNSYHQHSILRNNSQIFLTNAIPHNPDLIKKISTHKPKQNFPIRVNQSRFFIDDIEDYNTVSATIRMNTTNL